MEEVTDFTILGSKITADCGWNHEIKGCLLLGRKTITNLESILKSRDIALPTNVHTVKGMAFPVVMYWCEIWTIKKTESKISDAFKLWYWRRVLRVPWYTRTPNQSILKEINPGYSLEGLMLNLKLQYLGHLIWSANCGKDSHTGKFSSVQYLSCVRLCNPMHASFPCPSPTTGGCSNSCPLSWWCPPTIHPLLYPSPSPSVFPSIRVFSNESERFKPKGEGGSRGWGG